MQEEEEEQEEELLVLVVVMMIVENRSPYAAATDDRQLAPADFHATCRATTRRCRGCMPGVPAGVQLPRLDHRR